MLLSTRPSTHATTKEIGGAAGYLLPACMYVCAYVGMYVCGDGCFVKIPPIPRKPTAAVVRDRSPLPQPHLRHHSAATPTPTTPTTTSTTTPQRARSPEISPGMAPSAGWCAVIYPHPAELLRRGLCRAVSRCRYLCSRTMRNARSTSCSRREAGSWARQPALSCSGLSGLVWPYDASLLLLSCHSFFDSHPSSEVHARRLLHAPP